MRKEFGLSILISMFLLQTCSASENDYSKAFRHSEASYQQAWCSANGGITEYQNKDHTRVDCLTKTNAVEFDFATKWAESIGQALYYGIMTGKKPKVVLILDNPKSQMAYYNRLKQIGELYDIETEYVTNDILELNGQGNCPYQDCKCHKVTKK